MTVGGKDSRVAQWVLLLLVLGGLGVAAHFADRWNDRRREETDEERANKTKQYLQPLAEDAVAHACGMVIWIDYLQNKPDETWPTKYNSGGRGLPWEPIANFSNINRMEADLRDARTMPLLEAQDQIWAVRNAGYWLQLSAGEVLSAMIARDATHSGTEKSKFDLARYHANEALKEIRENFGDQAAACV